MLLLDKTSYGSCPTKFSCSVILYKNSQCLAIQWNWVMAMIYRGVASGTRNSISPTTNVSALKAPLFLNRSVDWRD